jgi:dTDP-4-dehydrorhamnose reductase
MFCNLTQAKNHVSTPTWARTLAEATGQIIAQGRGEAVDYLREKRGLYHLTDGGHCSRYAWAKSIIDRISDKNNLMVKELKSAKSSEFKSDAQRTQISVLNIKKVCPIFGLNMPGWHASLFYCLSKS